MHSKALALALALAFTGFTVSAYAADNVASPARPATVAPAVKADVKAGEHKATTTAQATVKKDVAPAAKADVKGEVKTTAPVIAGDAKAAVPAKKDETKKDEIKK